MLICGLCAVGVCVHTYCGTRRSNEQTCNIDARHSELDCRRAEPRSLSMFPIRGPVLVFELYYALDESLSDAA